MVEQPTATADTGRFVILGAGAVGTHLASALHEVGRNAGRIVIADVDAAIRDAWKARGVVVFDPACGLAAFDWQEADAVILATKATVAAAALKPVPEHVPVIGISNGIIMAADLGASRPVGWGVVDFAANLEVPGRSLCTHEGGLTLGENAVSRRLAHALDGSSVRSRLITDIDGYRWSKLLYNASFEPVGALAGQTFGEVFAHRPSRRALRLLLREGVAVACAAGINLQPVHGSRPSTLARVLATPLVSELAGFVGARQAGRVKGNMLIDLGRGVPTEVDFFNGHIVRTAQRLGIPAPTHERAVRLIHQLEHSGDTPAPERVFDLAPRG